MPEQRQRAGTGTKTMSFWDTMVTPFIASGSSPEQTPREVGSNASMAKVGAAVGWIPEGEIRRIAANDAGFAQ